MSEWQPIESAPKDGQKLLLWFLGEVVVGKWSSDYRWWYGNNVKWFDGQQLVTALQDGVGQGGPTHWQPHPAPPTNPSPSTVTGGAL